MNWTITPRVVIVLLRVFIQPGPRQLPAKNAPQPTVAMPPSTGMIAPVRYEPARDAKKMAENDDIVKAYLGG